jgi:hypothetical protein
MRHSGLGCSKIDRKLIQTFLVQLASTGRLERTLAV